MEIKTGKQERNTNRTKGAASIQKKRSGEPIVDRIVGHLTLAALLLLFGLLFKDQFGFRGFPLGWFHQPQFTRYDRLIASFLILLAVTVCADLISAAIGRIKEPAMRTTENKAPSGISAETIAVPVESTGRDSARTATNTARKADFRNIRKPVVNNRPAGGGKGKNKISALIWIVVGISILSFMGSVIDDNDFDTDDSSDYDTEYNDTNDYDPYEYYTLRDIADDVIYHFKWGEYDDLSGLGDMKPFEDLGDLSTYHYELFKYQYYTTDDEKNAVFKYVLYEDYNDENADVYLAGVLLSGDVTEDYPKDTKAAGFTIYKFGSHDEFENFYDKEDGEVIIDSLKCISIGETEAEGMFILNMKEE